VVTLLKYSLNVLNEKRHFRRRCVMKMSTVGEGVEWKSVHASKVPNELNQSLQRFIMGQKLKTLDTFFRYQKGLNMPINHLKLLSL